MTHAVAIVRTHSEFELLERLEQSGHEGYCPASISRVRPSGMPHTVPVKKAAWPGYLLVKAKRVEWHDGTDLVVDHVIEPSPVYDDPRFHGFLGYEDRLSLVTGIDDYRDREARGMYNPENKGLPEFLKGEVYKVLSGPWQSMVGEAQCAQDGRVWLRGYDFKYTVSIDGLLLRRHCVESQS